MGKQCQTTRTKELPNFTKTPHTRTAPPPRTTENRITRPDMSTLSKHWNMPTKLSSCRRKLIESPRNRPGSRKQRSGGTTCKSPGLRSDGTHGAGVELAYSCRTTLKREVLICRPPLYLMKPSFLNLFKKKLTRGRVVPIISASVSYETLGSTP